MQKYAILLRIKKYVCSGDVPMKTSVFLLLGTNMGDRHNNLTAAVVAIGSTVGSINNLSSVYETAAWGEKNQQPFYNQVIVVETCLSPQKVLDEVLRIEQNMGRKRGEKWGERIIDIDILFYGDEIIESDRLLIPHPELAGRRFTLVPLNEIAPTLKHPILLKEMSVLLNECPDHLGVERI